MSRPAMRFLSTRLHCLQRAPRLQTSLGSVRAVSRYSNPGARATTLAPQQTPSFVGSGIDAESLKADFTNPVDDAAARREFEAAKAHHLHRMRFAGIGLLLSVAGLSLILYNLDLDDIEKAGNKGKIQLDASTESNEQFQGRDVHVIGAGEDKRIIAEGKEETELVQTGSGSVPYFPRRIYLPISADSTESPAIAANIKTEDEYTLVGLGIRTVTFLGIEVSLRDNTQNIALGLEY